MIGLWGELALATRRELLAALVGSSPLANELLRALERHAIVAGELDAPTREALLHHPDRTVRSRASDLLAKFVPADRSSVLARYRPALKLQGYAQGQGHFFADLSDLPSAPGPRVSGRADLSGVAGRAPEALLSDILDPNREVAPDFATIAIAKRSGQAATGLLAEETATTLKLRRAEGVEETVLRSEIEQVRSTGLSLMPEGLEQGLSLQDLADLIAFLRQGALDLSQGSSN